MLCGVLNLAPKDAVDSAMSSRSRAAAWVSLMTGALHLSRREWRRTFVMDRDNKLMDSYQADVSMMNIHDELQSRVDRDCRCYLLEDVSADTMCTACEMYARNGDYEGGRLVTPSMAYFRLR